MKTLHLLIAIVVIISVVNAAPSWFSNIVPSSLSNLVSTPDEYAQRCNKTLCKLPACQCYGQSPQLDKAKIPQIVMISTDDAVNLKNFDELYKPLYFSRKNPNGCPISATFFVPHEYTDYAKVHELYANGFEIGVNSITKDSSAEYWAKSDDATIEKEFSGQKQIIKTFAKIPKEAEIAGARIPLLQINGDLSYSALQKSKLVYDNSWTSSKVNIWPYTLDYLSEQQCNIGKCPQYPHKGFWIIPVQNWVDDDDLPCATVMGCQNFPQNNVEAIYKWLIKNFDLHYKNKAPMNIIINSGIFGMRSEFYEAYKQFLDHLGKQKDVFIVNQSSALEWVKNPKAFDAKDVFKCSESKEKHDKTKEKVCPLLKGEETRYMTIYDTNCPNQYPWLGNPSGN